MQGQPSLITVTADAFVKRPGGVGIQRQFFRRPGAQGTGVYCAMDENGAVEIIGGPGSMAGGIPFGNDTDVAANNVQVALPQIVALTDGVTFEVDVLTTNTGATTLQINALGAKAVVDTNGNPLVAGMLVNDSIYLFVYDLNNDRYQLLGLARPGADEVWEDGSGLESGQLINTALPNNASGDHSIAEGSSTTSSGLSSHAEGFGTIALGANAHAEGNITEANGNNSHSEGLNTEANGLQAHSEGENTVANGANSHSEGLASMASGARSHAEGNTTEAQGDNSHAEGGGSQSIGTNSHAEGNSTASTGINSHSQNINTRAIGANSHAAGLGSFATGNNSFNHSTSSGAGTSDSLGEDSAIIGGVDNNVDAASPRSVVLGGTANNIVAEPDTAQAQELRVTDNIKVTQGANKPVGTDTLIAGSAVVANTLVVATSKIFITMNTSSATPGILEVPDATIVPGVSFTVNSNDLAGAIIATDTSTFNYLIINP